MAAATKTIRIMLADDHGIIREGLHILLEQYDDVEIIGEASNGYEAVELAVKIKPDLIIMDVSMPTLNGVEATFQILKQCPEIKVLALSAFTEKTFIKDMFNAGVSGYILKDCVISELIYAIRTVMNGECFLSNKIAGIVVDGYLNKNESEPGTSPLSQLTSKERELLQLLTEGKSNKEAARWLHVSTKTVDARRRELMNKLKVNSIVALTKLAIREGITTVDF